MNILFKLFICFLSLGIENQAHSSERWIKYQSDSTTENFIDINSIHKSNGITSYVGLLNFKNPLTPTASVIWLYEVRCSEKDIRFIESTAFSKLFGTGRKIGVIQPSNLGLKNGKFYPVDNNSNNQYNFICSNS